MFYCLPKVEYVVLSDGNRISWQHCFFLLKTIPTLGVNTIAMHIPTDVLKGFLICIPKIYLQQEVIDVAGEEALELGLLFGTENLTPQEEETDVLCFAHLMLQEFAGAVFIAKQDKVHEANHIHFYSTYYSMLLKETNTYCLRNYAVLSTDCLDISHFP